MTTEVRAAEYPVHHAKNNVLETPTDASALVKRIQSEPTAAQTRSILVSFRTTLLKPLLEPPFAPPSAAVLDTYAAALAALLIPTFIDDVATARELVLAFTSVPGIGALISRLSVAPQHEILSLVRILERILEQPGTVALLVAAQPREAANLLAGSRVHALAAARLPDSWLGDVRRYTKWFAEQLLASSLAADAALFDRAAKLGAPTVLASAYLASAERFGALQTLWPRLRRVQQRFLLVQALLPALGARTPGQAARVLVDLGVDATLLFDICLHAPVAGIPNLLVARTAVVVARESGALLETITPLVREWGSRIVFERAPLMAKQTTTQLLVAACLSLSPADAAAISHSADFLEGVSLHLDSTSESVRRLGTLAAETFAKRAGEKLEFGIRYDDHEWWLGVDPISPAGDIVEATHSNSPSEPAYSGAPLDADVLAGILDPPAPADVDVDDTEGDSDDVDADSEEEVPPPFYLKDLVAYLQSEKYAEVHAGLTVGARLIVRKAPFGSEVPQYAPELLRVACALNDTFSITNFGELRQGILNAVVAADPQQAPVVVAMFTTGDWSLAQRQSLLATLTHAAHELSQGVNRAEFERLPPALHRLFWSPEDAARMGVGALSLKSREQIAVNEDGGTVVRRSQRLVKGAASGPAVPVKNRFAPVSHLFFFPLVAAVPPLRAGSYDALVYAQWLRTLGVLAVEAYPTQHMPDMLGELWPVLRGGLVAGHHEVVVEEALYTCLLMLITVAGGLIVELYAGDVGGMLDAVARRAEAAQEPRGRGLALAAGRELAALARAIEQRLIPPVG